MRRVDVLLRSCSHEDYDGEAYVPINAYRLVQHDLAETEQHLLEAVNEVDRLEPYRSEALRWRFLVFVALPVFSFFAKRWGYLG
jgi:hypothetical protein